MCRSDHQGVGVITRSSFSSHPRQVKDCRLLPRVAWVDPHQHSFSRNKITLLETVIRLLSPLQLLFLFSIFDKMGRKEEKNINVLCYTALTSLAESTRPNLHTHMVLKKPGWKLGGGETYSPVLKI